VVPQRAGGKRLREYIQTDEGKPFLEFWTEAEVDAADELAAAQSE
jgi:hypothetical protein